MKAAIYHEFQAPIRIDTLPDPRPPAHGVVLQVTATGICRSDWHGWMGHDADVNLPHVPGHELAGRIVALGEDVTRWRSGDRVTLPFVCGCGGCRQCATGNHQVCDHQFQPGFTHWGSFAEFVAIHYADTNLVGLPDTVSDVTAASLGCRFVTAFRAVVDQGRLGAGEWVAVHGCGGVGLSAIMIACAVGARVVAVDITAEKLELARRIGAVATVNAAHHPAVVDAVADVTAGGAHLSLDCLGSPTTCFNSVANLRKRGRHVQVGLMLADHRHPSVPMDKVIADELVILGSHGIPAHRYDALLAMIAHGRLTPEKLIGKTVSLAEGIDILMRMDRFEATGVTVIDRF
ncbi:MAG: zinc-dependent alcohol dehydrogenase family protein [Desulfosarcinaceae bacterium]|nr:zinc-dependent alcohol dehydrogenase family protein [Desulfosarcinaceae bacterium]